ncbi:SCO2322 family protein [Mobilicoccus caccae]|uniref:MYXO-CTERM domain-containing protein n=1 Tax=Mobilicoccus caccae TaxID=1859295 RepID=A0ABQ6INE3_9MICO|nr:SCO2322 family protein [Mobilicoccus caccae]GMA39425.1 hypothetical protein GCM10025883_14700 [Mobilicoccus caccae]
MTVPTRVSRVVRPSVVLLLTALFVVVAGGTAQASSYRFWGYYPLVNGAWTFATTGPAQTAPADGAVEGWRYAVAGMEEPRFPRATPTFEQICGATPAAEGKKRVGVLLDYGRQADAADGAAPPPEPRTACAVVATDASGADVLAAVASTRLEAGVTCGVDGYPASGCSEEVATPPAAAVAADEPVSPRTDSPAPSAPAAHPSGTGDAQAAATAQEADEGIAVSAWVLAGLVVAAVAAAVTISLRRRRQSPDRG